MAYVVDPSEKLSTDNSSTSPLSAGATYTGTFEDTLNYPSVVFAVKTDQAGSLIADFSPDGTNVDSSLTYSIEAGINEVHRLTCTRRYFRIRFNNTSASNQTYFRLQSILGNHNLLSSPLNSTIQTDADTIVTRSVLYGQLDSGRYKAVPVTAEGHLEATIHGPRNPFGSVHVENLLPVFQSDAVYFLNRGQVSSGTTFNGTATSTQSMFTCTTSTTIYGSGYIQSRKRLRYRPGQGVVSRFTGKFTTGVADSYQVVGIGHGEDGVYFGYKGADFGILYNSFGVREIQTLTVTTAVTGAGNVTVTLNGTANVIAISAAAVGDIARTVYELSQGVFTYWKAQCNGAGTQVVFIADSVGNAAGAFSVSGSGIVGSFAETTAGAAVTEVFIPQDEWNMDVMDGTGSTDNPSGVLLDPTKLNVFQIKIQYLGAGAITFEVEVVSDGNNPDFATVHALRLPNTLTKPSFGNPSFPFTMSAYSQGSTTNLTVQAASFAGFIEGQKRLHGNRFSYYNAVTTGNASTYVPLFTVYNSLVHNNRANQSVINILSINAAVKHTQPVVFYLIKNGALTGSPSFNDYASNLSCTLYDSSATQVTFSTQDQLVWSGHLGETGQIDHSFAEGGPEELTLQPGEWFTLAVKSVQNNVAWATGSINTREDQ